MVPVRLYKTSYCDLKDNHELVTYLPFPYYDVFGWDGQEKEVVGDVPREEVLAVINSMRNGNPKIGVIGVSKIGINADDADLIAKCGVGIH